MDERLLYDNVFPEPVDISDTPWSMDNLLFEEDIKSDSDDDITDLFNGGKIEDVVSTTGTQRKIKDLSDEEIKNLRVQDLNKLLRGIPREEAVKIRRKRRNLKNRGYALTCRRRRQQFQEDLFNENQLLKKQLEDGRETLCKVLKERSEYKKKFLQLQSDCKKELMVEHFVLPNFLLESGNLA